MNTDKQKFLNTLKYGKHYNEILKEITVFREFVIKKKNGTISIHYNKKNKQFIITTYLPKWKTKKFKNLSTLELYINAKNLFNPFINEGLCWWLVDDTCGNGIVEYYVYIDEYPLQ